MLTGAAYHSLLANLLTRHGGRRALRNPLSVLREWQVRARDRAALRDLDPRLIEDVGLSAEDIRREVRKPFWVA